MQQECLRKEPSIQQSAASQPVRVQSYPSQLVLWRAWDAGGGQGGLSQGRVALKAPGDLGEHAARRLLPAKGLCVCGKTSWPPWGEGHRAKFCIGC